MRGNALAGWVLSLLCGGLNVVCAAPATEPPSPAPPSQSTADGLFRTVLRKPGDDGSQAYRIPGLAVSTKGTLLAAFDIRYQGAGDLPADIDVGLLRSTDGGATWGGLQKVMDYDARAPNARGNGVGDPAILVDHKTGAIWVAALWSQGNRGWNGSGPGLKPEETGQFVLSKSTDDGLSWSPPVSITPQIKDPAWRLCFQGPGSGIQTRDGALVFAAQFRDGKGVAHSCFVHSGDGGAAWRLSPPAIPNGPPTSEAQIAELRDGSLLLTMRDESRSGQRLWATWTWPTASNQPAEATPGPLRGAWSPFRRDLPDPTCMASLIRHPSGLLLFANPNSPKQRVALTIRGSRDEGQTWPLSRLLDERPCMYSSLAVLADGRVGIVYEVAGTLTFARFPLEWLGK